VALRVTADGRDLEVRSVSETHNHDRSMLQFQYLPHQRRLSGKDKESVEELLALRANKKLVKQKLEQETGKVLTLKDLSNIGQKSGKKSENLDKCVDVLRNRYNAEVNILKDGENNFKGMFIQTSNMKNTFKAYPEFLGIDGTYKLINIGIPVFLIVAEDGNCQTEIICFCLLITEDKDSFTWFLETFRANNPQTELTKYVMADKDLLERSVLKDTFSEANVIICIFHSMRTFSREITCEKMGISQADRNKSLELLQKMVYAKTEGEFEQLHNLLNISAPKRVIEYFDKNWYPIKDEWSMSKNFMKGCFQNTTNNRIESINAKLKSVITKNSTLVEFVHSFFTIISSLESERDFKAIYQLQKRLVTSYLPGSDEQNFLDFLTNEASRMVIKQIEFSKKVKVPSKEDNESCFVISSTEGQLRCDPTDCSCNFKAGMLLPCRHIFTIRTHLKLPLFLEELVNKCWTLDYYKTCQRRLAHDYCNNK
jgi:zinc finger SWIM domain-containing protein 3